MTDWYGKKDKTMACLTVMVGKVKGKRTRRFRFRRKDENRSPGRGDDKRERV